MAKSYLKIVVDRKTEEERIRHIYLADVHLNYPYLTDDNRDQWGRTGVQVLVSKDKDIELLQEYLNEVIEKGKLEFWGGQVPANLYLPISKADGDEGSIEEQSGAVLKIKSRVSTEYIPDLYYTDTNGEIVQVLGKNHAKTMSKDDANRFYSGVLADVILTLSPYKSKSGDAFIAAWVSGILIVGEGIDTYAQRETDFGAIFAEARDTEVVETTNPLKGQDDNEESAQPVQLADMVTKKEVKPKAVTKSVESKEAPESISTTESISSLSDLIKGPKATVTKLSDLLK